MMKALASRVKEVARYTRSAWIEIKLRLPLPVYAASRSIRSAWIEIIRGGLNSKAHSVARHAERVE